MLAHTHQVAKLTTSQHSELRPPRQQRGSLDRFVIEASLSNTASNDSLRTYED